MKKEELFAPIREKYAALKAALNGTDTVYGSRRMGDENIGRRRCDYRFSLCLVIGILGKADERRYDINPHDRSPYDAFTALPESFAGFRIRT